MAFMQVLTLMIVTLSLASATLCSNRATNGKLSFQSDFAYLALSLVPGISVELECCVKSARPSVSWTMNGIPLQDNIESLAFSEQQQILTTSLVGLFMCVASDSYASIYKTFNITTRYIDTSCNMGAVGEIRTGSPPKDVYDVPLYSSIQLTCIVNVYCGNKKQASGVHWLKFSDYPQPYSQVYDLYESSSEDPTDLDNFTGDFISVSARYIDDTEKVVVIQAVLTIRNVTENELFDLPSVPTTDCQNSTNNSCTVATRKAHYQCFIALEESDDPSQQLYNKLVDARLHVSLASDSKDQISLSALVMADKTSMEKEGIIFGCLLGAFVLFSASVALIYVKYEWHIRIYVKRLMIWMCAKGNDRNQYCYDCYIACANADEELVYGVLREHLERDMGYRLCLPERDFSIGAAVPEQISCFIEKSEFFMAIISSRFWMTDWCNLAVDIALRTNTKVIAVFILDEPKAKANKRADVAKALRAPGCSQFVYRSWKRANGNDNLALKLQFAMPKLTRRSTDQRHVETDIPLNKMP